MQLSYQTNRLILSQISLADINDVANLFEDETLNQLSGLRLPAIRSEKLVSLTMLVNQQNSRVYLLKEKNSQEVIGLVVFYRLYLLNYVYSEMDCEIGFVLKQDKWGQGLMTEALQTLLVGYFDETDFVGIYGGALNNNIRSQKLVKRLGFKLHKLPDNLSPDQFDKRLDYFYLSQSMLS